MASRITTFGPREDFDGETGEPIFVYLAEALGSDGVWHIASTYSGVTPFVEVQEAFRAGIGKILENRMKEEGVWDGEQEAVVR